MYTYAHDIPCSKQCYMRIDSAFDPEIFVNVAVEPPRSKEPHISVFWWSTHYSFHFCRADQKNQITNQNSQKGFQIFHGPIWLLLLDMLDQCDFKSATYCTSLYPGYKTEWRRVENVSITCLLAGDTVDRKHPTPALRLSVSLCFQILRWLTRFVHQQHLCRVRCVANDWILYAMTTHHWLPPMATPWLLYGYSTATLWLLYGYSMATRLLYGYSMIRYLS